MGCISVHGLIFLPLKKIFRNFLRCLVKFRQWLFGYDFFIAYHWESGGEYAANLASSLAQKYSVFFDRTEYATDEDWKVVGHTTLNNTTVLIVIATVEGVTESEPLKGEVAHFRKKQTIGGSERPIFKIVFSDKDAQSLKPAIWNERFGDNPDKLVLIEPPNSDGAIAPASVFRNHPSTTTITSIENSIGILSRRFIRSLVIGGTGIGLFLLSIFSIGFYRDSVASWEVAQQSYAQFCVENCRIELSRGDIGKSLLWAGETLTTESKSTENHRHSAEQLIAEWEPFVATTVESSEWGSPVNFTKSFKSSNYMGVSLRSGEILIWDCNTEKRLNTNEIKHKQCHGIFFSHDGAFLATTDATGGILVWESRTGKLRQDLSILDGMASSLSFDEKNESLIVQVSNGNAELFVTIDIESKVSKSLANSGDNEFNSFHAIHSPAQPLIAIAQKKRIKQTEVLQVGPANKGPIILAESRGRTRIAENLCNEFLKFSPDGKILVAGPKLFNSGLATIWNVENRTRIGEIPMPSGIRDIAFDANSRLVALWGASSFALFDMNTRNLLRSLDVSLPVRALFMKNSDVVLLANNKLLVLNPFDSNEPMILLEHESLIFDACVSPNSQHVSLVGPSGLLKVAKIPFRNPEHTVIETGVVSHWAVDRKGKQFFYVVDSTALNCFDLKGKSLPKNLLKSNRQIRDVAFEPERLVVAVDGDNELAELLVMNKSGSNQKKFPLSLNNSRLVIKFSGDGAKLAIGSAGGKVQMWDCSNWKMIAESSVGTPVVSLEFSPSSSHLIAICPKNCWLFNGQTLDSQVSIGPDFQDFVLGVRFAPNGETVAVANGNVVDIYNVLQRSLVRKLGHSGKVWSIDFDSAGQRLATLSSDGLVRQWETDSWNYSVRPIRHHIRRIGISLTRGISTAAAPAGVLRYSDNGRKLLVVGQTGGQILDSWSGIPLTRPLKQSFNDAGFVRTGAKLVSCHSDRIQLWKLRDPSPDQHSGEKIIEIQSLTKREIVDGVVMDIESSKVD